MSLRGLREGAGPPSRAFTSWSALVKSNQHRCCASNNKCKRRAFFFASMSFFARGASKRKGWRCTGITENERASKQKQNWWSLPANRPVDLATVSSYLFEQTNGKSELDKQDANSWSLMVPITLANTMGYWTPSHTHSLPMHTIMHSMFTCSRSWISSSAVPRDEHLIKTNPPPLPL